MPKTQAIDALAQLLDGGINPKKLDQVHDLLKLLGIVLGQMALLQITVDRDADEKARVSAARALMSTKEDPNDIAERLRRSPFADLTIAQLEGIVEKLKLGETDLSKLISPDTTSQSE